jgi:hypothetical protein
MILSSRGLFYYGRKCLELVPGGTPSDPVMTLMHNKIELYQNDIRNDAFDIGIHVKLDEYPPSC